MPGHSSSDHKSSKLSTIQTLTGVFAALAGVAFTGYQVLSSKPGSAPAPVQVTVAVDPASLVQAPKSTAVPEDTVSQKGDVSILAHADLSKGALLEAALKDGSEKRYDFARLFDDDSKTTLMIAAPDHEVNVMVNFAGGTTQRVATIEYTPPVGAVTAATILDVMVLPEGQLEASGRPVDSFELQTTAGKQTFTIPNNASGKAVFLRIAGPATADKIAVGDFRINN